MIPLGVLTQQQLGLSADPIEFVGSTFVYGTYTVTKPAGTANGDLMICQINSRNCYVTTISDGWTPLWDWGIGNTGGFVAPGGSANEETLCFYKFASSEPASYTVTAQNAQFAAGITVYRNVKSITHLEMPNTNVAPSMTGNTGDWLVTINGTSFEPVGVPTAPVGSVTRGSVYDAGYDVGTTIADEILSANGATGTRTYTGNVWDNYAVAASFILEKQTAGFDPNSIPGLITWLDGADPGATALTWQDKSGAGNDWTASQASQFPVASGDNMAFGGDDIIYGPNAYNGLAAAEIFVRMKSNISNGLWYFSNEGDNGCWYTYSNLQDAYVGWGHGVRPQVTLGVDVTTYHTLNIHTAANDWAMKVNGAVRSSTTSSSVNFVTAPYIGKMQAANYWLTGNIKSLCIFNKKLTTEERTQMNDYMDAL